MRTHFYFIRHGETDWNKHKRIQGHTDIPLNHSGTVQAQRIALRLANERLNMICSSDLTRAVQTAKAIKQYHPNIPFHIFQELRERNYGEWEGMTIEDISSRSSHQDHQSVQLPGVETIEEMQQRGLACLTQLAIEYPNHHVAIVSHGGFINALLHYFSNGEHGTGKTKLGNTALNYVSCHADQWAVHFVNDTSHLDIETD